ncbi:hypothetical protein [Lacticaseibacillus jixiensis]|uniref:hypothetical protein n=1 Tax=Lacticaseibacillus jixiensis TaxID=3231926 RepID=UPI0036F1FB6C
MITIVGVLLAVSVISVLFQRRKTQVLLSLMWKLDDERGYDAEQVKQLATFKHKRSTYSVAEWKLTQGSHPRFFPNQKAVQLVISKLQ